jgi:hypothetical protein
MCLALLNVRSAVEVRSVHTVVIASSAVTLRDFLHSRCNAVIKSVGVRLGWHGGEEQCMQDFGGET